MISHDIPSPWSQAAGLTKMPVDLLQKAGQRLAVLVSAARIAHYCETELANKGYLDPESLEKIKTEMDTWP